MERQVTGDVSVFSLGGASQLTVFKNASLKGDIDTVDSSPASRVGKKAQGVKKEATLTTELMSINVGSTKVSHLNVSNFSIGGTPFLADLRDGTLAGTFTHTEGSATGDLWKWPNVADKDFSWNGTLLIPKIAGVALAQQLYSDDVGDAELDVSVTIHGTVFTIPMTMVSGTHVLNDKDQQLWECSFMGNSPDTGAYPTTPTTSTTLLSSCMNTPNAALAMVLTTHATEGLSYNGFFKPRNFSVGIKDAELVNVQYEFASRGQVVATPT